MLNPNIKIAKSTGVDLPIMYVYLAGRIAGNCIEKCVKWRKDIVKHYKNYKPIFDLESNPEQIIGYEAYPICFLDPLNSGEANSVDKLGLTSAIPPNLIYSKDLLSVNKADVVVANVEDYFEVGIEDFMKIPYTPVKTNMNYQSAFFALQEKIKTRRENFGTICEIAWALYLQKPLILIVPESRENIYKNHPFSKRASVIVTSPQQLIEEKWLNTLYKSIAGAI